MKRLWFIALTSVSSVCYGFERCGDFEVEGYLSKSADGSQMVMTLERGSLSKVEVDLGTYDPSRWKYFIDTNVVLIVRLENRCRFRCHGRIIKMIRALDPFTEPKPQLFPPLKPKSEIACLS